MSSVISWFGGDPNALINYFLGLIIIVLYAKDKFNTPTYDSQSMGPFSQLPPQLLTIDARYRQGLRIYIFLLLALYTALCIIGPSTFNNQNMQFGITASTNQFWPVASATFLISTGAAKDSSVLGKIEHFVRQYAQKTAYIPSIVSNLAYSIRNVETIPWLKEDKYKLKPGEFEDRKTALTALIGATVVAKINENPRQQGQLAAWARANIVFYCMQQMSRGVLPSEKLSQIIDLPENVAIFERLRKQRDELVVRWESAEEQRTRRSGPKADVDLDKLLSDVQRFSKEVSLTIVVLLSQAVRTVSDLRERLEQLGFREIELRDNSDHLVYIVMVNFCVLLGAFVAYAVVTTLASLASLSVFENAHYLPEWVHSFGRSVTKIELNDFSVIDHQGEFLTLATASLIYMIVFKVIDYLREGYLDLSEWQENLQGYVMVIVMASVCSAIICILLMVLLLSPINLLQFIWRDPAGLAQQFLYQLTIAGLAASFTVSYLRHAVQLQWENGRQKRLRRIILEGFVFIRGWSDVSKLVHSVLAALLAGVLTHAIIIHNRNNNIEAAKSNIDTLLTSFDQNQGWLGQQMKAAKRKTATPGSSTSKDVSLQTEDLIAITCTLRDMYAAINVFDAGEQDIQLDPDFVNAVSDTTSKAPQGPATATKCKPQKAGAKEATIDSQIRQVKDICTKLNRLGMPPTEKAGLSVPGAPPGANAVQPGERIITPTLFLAPERCELNKITANGPVEENVKGLGKSLSDLFFTLDTLNKTNVDAAAIIFPMISGFFIAYMFGAGCHVWRGWWLNNDAGQQEMKKLREQIERIYAKPVQTAGFERWLTAALSDLNGVAPLEAVRYEGLKARLYAKIESEQLDLTGVVADG